MPDHDKKSKVKEPARKKRKVDDSSGGEKVRESPVVKHEQRVAVVKAPTAGAGMKGKKGGSASASGAEGAMRKNALAYLAALYAPHLSAPARVPDLVSYPTSITKYTYTQAITLTTTQTSQYLFSPTFNTTGTGVSPLGLKAYSSRNDFGTTGTFGAWTTAADPNPTTGLGLYRTVGFGVQIVNTTPLLNRGGEVRMGRIANLGFFGTAVNAMSIDPRYIPYDLADTDLSKKVVPWLPFDYESSLEMLLAADATDKGGILFQFAPPGATQNLEFVVHHLVEFIPATNVSQYVEASSAPGSEADVAVGQSMISKAAGYLGGVITPEMATTFAQYAVKMWGGGGDSYGWSGGGGGMAAPAGYFAKNQAFREVLQHFLAKAIRSGDRQRVRDIESLLSEHNEFTSFGRVRLCQQQEDWTPVPQVPGATSLVRRF